MDLDLVFLGTSASVPTANRNVAGLLLRRGGDRLLFDCGEGTQRQLLRSTIGLPELGEVFLTHYHADHFLGLPGMLKTFALRGREQPLTVYGPPGLRDLFGSLARVFGKLPYPLDLVEMSAGDGLDRGDHVILPFRTQHGVSANGYVLLERPRPGRFDVEAADALGVPPGRERGILQGGDPITLPDGSVVTPDEVLGPPRPGRKVVIGGDGIPGKTLLEAAREADVLVQEATFLAEERERAAETLHSTAAGVSALAREAAVVLLALTHISNRYFGPEVAREAREAFPATVVPSDFDIIDVPFRERGEPRLVKGGALVREADGAASRETVPTVEERTP
jgi:ribonuclease Z